MATRAIYSPIPCAGSVPAEQRDGRPACSTAVAEQVHPDADTGEFDDPDTGEVLDLEGAGEGLRSERFKIAAALQARKARRADRAHHRRQRQSPLPVSQ